MVLGSVLQLSTSLFSLGIRHKQTQNHPSSDHICGLLFLPSLFDALASSSAGLSSSSARHPNAELPQPAS